MDPDEAAAGQDAAQSAERAEGSSRRRGKKKNSGGRPAPRDGAGRSGDSAGPGARGVSAVVSEDPDLAAVGKETVGLAEVTELADVADLDAEVGPGDVDLADDGPDSAELEDLDVAVVDEDLDVEDVEVDVVDANEDVSDDEAAAGDDEDDEPAGPLSEPGPVVAAAAAAMADVAPGGPAAAAPGTAARAPGAAEEEFVYGDDDDDLPAAQVASAGATADPVKDYLKQIGKVPLLNAEQEVELAKRIEAGLFAEEKLAEGMDGLEVSARLDMEWIAEDGRGRRTTCSRPTCGWWCRWPSGTPAGACCSWT